MSTTIRPGGSVTPGATSVEGASETEATREAQSASELKAAGAVEHAQAASVVAPGAQVESPSAALLARLDAGEVTREQAIEGLVAQALEAHGGARLPEAQRTELASVLRAALEDDPTLSQLLGR